MILAPEASEWVVAFHWETRVTDTVLREPTQVAIEWVAKHLWPLISGSVTKRKKIMPRESGHVPLLFYKFHIWTWWCTEHPCHNSTPVLSRSLHPYKECLGVLLNFYFLICLLSENNKKGFSFQREKLCMNKYASEESGRTKFANVSGFPRQPWLLWSLGERQYCATRISSSTRDAPQRKLQWRGNSAWLVDLCCASHHLLRLVNWKPHRWSLSSIPSKHSCRTSHWEVELHVAIRQSAACAVPPSMKLCKEIISRIRIHFICQLVAMKQNIGSATAKESLQWVQQQVAHSNKLHSAFESCSPGTKYFANAKTVDVYEYLKLLIIEANVPPFDSAPHRMALLERFDVRTRK